MDSRLRCVAREEDSGWESGGRSGSAAAKPLWLIGG